MPIEVRMPQLGESVHEGTIGRWLKQQGDRIERFEPLLEVVTDKVDTEITAEASGTVAQILVPEGENVAVGTVLALLETGNAGMESEPAVAAPAMEAAGAEPDRAPDAAEASDDRATGEATPAPRTADGSPRPIGVGAPASAPRARVSPVAARVAAEHGLDITGVQGTGPGGRLTRRDLERAIAEGASGAASAGPPGDLGFISPRVARMAAEHGIDLRRVTGTGASGRITSVDVERFVAARGAARPEVASTTTTAAETELADEIVALTPMRRSIAEHMVRSASTAPHVATVHEADMSAVVAAYRLLRDQFADRGVKLTYTAFIIHAVAEALTEHPLVNSSWTEDGIRLRREVNVGMAVAVPNGLIVPVIRHADRKSLLGLAGEIVDLATRARERQLSPDEVHGGTFTISNYGTLGSLIGTPLINQPQAAILGVGAIRKRVVVVEGEEGDAIAIRPMMYLALSFDHRVLDGGSADPFVQAIVGKLASWQA